MIKRVSLLALEDFPLVCPGDDLPQLICDSLVANEVILESGDVVAVAQKIVSKAEDRYVNLAAIEPSAEAKKLSIKVDKDPRLVELILRESNQVVRHRPGVLIVEHQLGFVHANAGIDKSNLPDWEDDPRVLLLPEDPDQSAERIRQKLHAQYKTEIAVLINDSVGRAWRVGTTSMAIGTAGMNPLRNHVGDRDLFGRKLETTEIATADEIASAASMVMGQAAEGRPVVIARGVDWLRSGQGSNQLIRSRKTDLFR